MLQTPNSPMESAMAKANAINTMEMFMKEASKTTTIMVRARLPTRLEDTIMVTGLTVMQQERVRKFSQIPTFTRVNL